MNRLSWWSRTATAALALGLSACVEHPPAPLDPTVAQRVLGRDGAALLAPMATWPSDAWWRDLGDPVLAGIVDRVVAANPDIRTAETRARLAAHVAEAAGATRRPEVGVSGSLARERLSETGLAPPPYGGMTLTAGEVAVALGWKLDLWGAERARVSARALEHTAAEFDARFVRQAVAAAAARLYFELGAARAERTLAHAAETAGEEGIAILRHRAEVGLDRGERLEHARAELAARVIERASAEGRVAAARNALAALEGEGPDATANLTPEDPPPGPWGVPSDLRVNLLAHRADVVAARARALAAAREAEAARADRLPNVSITALAALNSLVPGLLFDAASRQTSLGGAVDLPIFDGGRRRATADARGAAFEAAEHDYERVLIGAVHQVADAIAEAKSVDASRAASLAALEAEGAAAARVELRARNGLADQIEVLTALDGVRLAERRDRALLARQQALRVDLLEALGGGVAVMGETK